MVCPEDGVRLDSADVSRLDVERSLFPIEEDGADVNVFHGEFAGVLLVLHVGLHRWVRGTYS